VEGVVRCHFVQELQQEKFSNYRGIYVLSGIPKLFEKLVCVVVTSIIRPSISDKEHDFVGGRSIRRLVLWSFLILS
jgi:hypothetical protein